MDKQKTTAGRSWPSDVNVQDVAQAILHYSTEHPGELPRYRWIAGRLKLSLSTVAATLKVLTQVGAVERFAAGATLKKANFRTALEAQRMVDRYRMANGGE